MWLIEILEKVKITDDTVLKMIIAQVLKVSSGHGTLIGGGFTVISVCVVLSLGQVKFEPLHCMSFLVERRRNCALEECSVLWFSCSTCLTTSSLSCCHDAWHTSAVRSWRSSAPILNPQPQERSPPWLLQGPMGMATSCYHILYYVSYHLSYICLWSQTLQA